MTKISRPSIVVLTHMMPIDNADNAGQTFVSAQIRYWQRTHDVRCIIIQGRSASHDAGRSIAEYHVLESARSSAFKRLTSRVGSKILRSLPGVPNPDLLYDLRLDRVASNWLRAADVVVLEWQRESGLAGPVKLLFGRPRVISVLHDVDSQAIGRRLAQNQGHRDRFKLTIQRFAAAIAERAIVGTADDIIVLSGKDAALLPRGSAKVHIVPPPITAPKHPQRNAIPGSILFVAGARPENEDALRWFLNEVLPHTDGLVSPEQIAVVGRQSEKAMAEFTARGVRMTGFIADLSSAYERASVAVVPMRLGAGVKFKTLEAILHRVPLITTTVGAEGVLGLEGTVHVTDSAQLFAERLVAKLGSPSCAQLQADQLYDEVLQEMGPQAFAASLGRVMRADNS